jgi:DNA-binding NtrC family response regulator
LTPDPQCPPGHAPARNHGDFNAGAEFINVLIVADGADDLIPRLAEMEPRGCLPLTLRVTTREDFLAALISRSWDVVIAEHVLTQFSGPEALKLLRHQGSDVPFIMVSDVFGGEKAATMIRAGANDYLENLSRLVPVLERELRAAQDRRRCQRALGTISQLAATVRKLQNAVEYDAVPGPDNHNSDAATTAAAPSDLGAAFDTADSTGEFPTLGELEKRHIFAALDRCRGNRTAAAALLSITTRTLRNKLHQYNGTSPQPGYRALNQAPRNRISLSAESAARGGTSIPVASKPGRSGIFPVPVYHQAAMSPGKNL